MLDFMLVNGCVAWNMSVQLDDIFRDTIDDALDNVCCQANVKLERPCGQRRLIGHAMAFYRKLQPSTAFIFTE